VISRSALGALGCAALIAGCGSSRGNVDKTPLAHGGTPIQRVARALLALGTHAYTEHTKTTITFATSGVPAALASRFASLGESYSGVMRFTNAQNLQITVRVNSRTEYIRAVNGAFSASLNGKSYSAVPASVGTALDKVFQGAFATLARHVSSVTDLGPATVGGTAAERYSGSVPLGAFTGEVSSLLKDPSLLRHLTYSPSPLTVYLDRATGAPVEIVEADTAKLNLTALDKPGVSGIVIIRTDSLTSYSDFR
jgi:hypothetical protein